MPGGSELQPVSGIVKSDGQSLSFDAIKGKIGGGDVTASIDARQSAERHRIECAASSWPASTARRCAIAAGDAGGRASMQMTLASQGRSASALTGALSGSGTVTLEPARIAGLDPRAFEVAIRASDGGRAHDDTRLRQIVEPVLSAGALSVESAQIPFSVRDGRLRVGATTLDADGVRAIVSGGYDIPADQADIRAASPDADAAGRAGDPAVCGGNAGRARPHRRCRVVVVLAGGAGDRSRNPAAGFDRARRTAAAGAGANRFAARGRGPRVQDSCAPPGELLSRVPLPGRDPRKLPSPRLRDTSHTGAAVYDNRAGRQTGRRQTHRCR